jgi:hypothetical protein
MLCFVMKWGTTVGSASEFAPPRSAEEKMKCDTPFLMEASTRSFPCFSSFLPRAYVTI